MFARIWGVQLLLPLLRQRLEIGRKLGGRTKVGAEKVRLCALGPHSINAFLLEKGSHEIWQSLVQTAAWSDLQVEYFKFCLQKR